MIILGYILVIIGIAGFASTFDRDTDTDSL